MPGAFFLLLEVRAHGPDPPLSLAQFLISNNNLLHQEKESNKYSNYNEILQTCTYQRNLAYIQ